MALNTKNARNSRGFKTELPVFWVSLEYILSFEGTVFYLLSSDLVQPCISWLITFNRLSEVPCALLSCRYASWREGKHKMY